ncbi:MAG: hypothetical protein ACK53Y_14325, partial [bacterium]
PLEPLLNTSQSCSPPRTAASHPSDLATLSHILSLTDIVTSTQVHPIPPITNQDASSPPISMAGNIIGAPPPIINEGPMNIITKDDSSLSSDTTQNLEQVYDHTITKWTIHRPFIPGTKSIPTPQD